MSGDFLFRTCYTCPVVEEIIPAFSSMATRQRRDSYIFLDVVIKEFEEKGIEQLGIRLRSSSRFTEVHAKGSKK